MRARGEHLRPAQRIRPDRLPGGSFRPLHYTDVELQIPNVTKLGVYWVRGEGRFDDGL
jgi:hypothetical protein